MNTQEHTTHAQDLIMVAMTLEEAITTNTALAITKATGQVTRERAESVIEKIEQAIEKT